MSESFSLVCHETRRRVWIGQGRDGTMNALYSGEVETMEKLKTFLNDHRGESIVFLCDDRNDRIMDYTAE